MRNHHLDYAKAEADKLRAEIARLEDQRAILISVRAEMLMALQAIAAGGSTIHLRAVAKAAIIKVMEEPE